MMLTKPARWLDIGAHFKDVHFALGQETPGALLEPLLGEAREIDPVEGLDVVAEGFEDAADDAVLARVDLDAEFAVVGVDIFEFVGGDGAVGKFDAAQDGLAVLFGEGTVEVDLVDLLLVVGGMRQALGHLAVVGEEEDTGGVLVKPADGEYAYRGLAEQVHHGLLRMRVAGGGDIAAGLVHDHIDFFLSLETLAVEADVVGEDIDLGAEFGDDFAVDGDAAGLDQTVGFPAGADARIGDVFVEADNLLHGRLDVIVVGDGGVELLLAFLDHPADAVILLGRIFPGAGLGAVGLAFTVGLVAEGPGFAVSGCLALSVCFSLTVRFAVSGGHPVAVWFPVTVAPALAVTAPRRAGSFIVETAVGRVDSLRASLVGGFPGGKVFPMGNFTFFLEIFHFLTFSFAVASRHYFEYICNRSLLEGGSVCIRVEMGLQRGLAGGVP